MARALLSSRLSERVSSRLLHESTLVPALNDGTRNGLVRSRFFRKFFAESVNQNQLSLIRLCTPHPRVPHRVHIGSRYAAPMRSHDAIVS